MYFRGYKGIVLYNTISWADSSEGWNLPITPIRFVIQRRLEPPYPYLMKLHLQVRSKWIYLRAGLNLKFSS